MGQFSVEKPVAPGSALSGNQQPDDGNDEDLKGDEKKEAEKNKEAARVWISGLEAVNRKLKVTPYRRGVSATPLRFYLPWPTNLIGRECATDGWLEPDERASGQFSSHREASAKVVSVRALTFIARRRPSLISFQAVVRPMPAQAVKSAIDIAPPRGGLFPVIAMGFSQVARALCGFADIESWTTHVIGASAYTSYPALTAALGG
jgi:hypothetical protein